MNTSTIKPEIRKMKNLSFHEDRSREAEIYKNTRTNFSNTNNRRVRNKTVVIVGLGYVGLPLSLLALEKGYRVIGVDQDERKIDLIRKQTSPILDKKIEETLSRVKLSVSSNPIFIREAGIVVICVPTPVDHDCKPDFAPLESAAQSVAKHMSKGTLVIVESTVNPGVCESLVLPILEAGSGFKMGEDFELAHCPERINPGDEKWTLETINRVVGSTTPKGLRQSLAFYRSIIGKGKITPMATIKEAEAVKIIENSFRDVNIAFVNELAMSFKVLGIDVVNVIKGASTKPFSFLAHYPGCGVGGHCIPVDPYYLIEHARLNGFEHRFLMLARDINSNMPIYTTKILAESLKSKNLPLGKGKIVILGASYKPNIDDIRESPSFEIYKELERNGYEPILHDPHVNKEGIEKDIDRALEGSTAVIVATAHKEFLALTPTFFITRGIKIVIDGRNCLNKKLFEDSGLTYHGIGR